VEGGSLQPPQPPWQYAYGLEKNSYFFG